QRKENIMSNTYYAPQPPQPKKKLGGIKIAGIVVGGLILLGAVGNTLSDDQPEAAPQPTVTVTATAEAPAPTPEPPAPAEKTPTPTPPPPPTKEAEPTKEPEPEFTREEENAIQSARDYLDFMAFSRKGLVEQLEYEGYPRKVAEKAVDHLDVDWMEQAVLSAESY